MAEVAAKGSLLSPYGRRSTGVLWRKRGPFCVGFPRCSPSLGIDNGRGSSCSSGGFHGGRLVLGDRSGEPVNRIAVCSPVQEGRMRGQAFVTFPSVNLAQHALNLVNGYVFKGKAMIIQFGRNPVAVKAT